MLTIVSCFGFDWQEVADRSEQTTAVEAVAPFERRYPDGQQSTPRTAFMNELRFVQAVDGLGQRIVVRVARAARRRLDACVVQLLRVTQRDVLLSRSRKDGSTRRAAQVDARRAPAPAHSARSP